MSRAAQWGSGWHSSLTVRNLWFEPQLCGWMDGFTIGQGEMKEEQSESL